MLLLLMEKNMPIDCVIYADTTMEFPEMKAHIAKLDELLFREQGLHITTLQHPQGFEWMMFERPVNRTPDRASRGYGWPLAASGRRWCTGHLKQHLVSKEVTRLKKENSALNLIGIAADEAHRCKKNAHDRYPLVEWGITEAQALQICYDRGFDWDGLYEIYRRCSCWCCPLQRISELRKLRRHHPELWARLLDMDRRAIAQFGRNALGQFKQNWTVEELEQRFAAEDAQISIPGFWEGE